ncbi:MAG TPA: hypothetical protein PKI67_07330 [bacterium]|nr:hypothetical protein [bacterium]
MLDNSINLLICYGMIAIQKIRALFFYVIIVCSAGSLFADSTQAHFKSKTTSHPSVTWSSLDQRDGLFFLSSSREETTLQLKETRHKAWIAPSIPVSFITYRKYLDFFQLSLTRNFLLGYTTGLRAPPRF